jgi:hypothetical protein
MKLPKQVQEAGDRADQALQQHNAAADAAPDQPIPGTEAPAPTPSDPPAATPPAEPAPTPAPAPDRTDWKAKYHTLQGMYNADVPRLQKDLKAATDRVDSLVEEVADLKTRLVTAAPAPAAPAPEPEVVSAPAALVTALGQEGADALIAAITHQVSGIRSDVDKGIATVKESADNASKTADQLAQERANDRRTAFMAALTERVPDWPTIDNDERWHAYLMEKSREARRPRQELIAEAYRDGDLDAVAGFFEAFKEKVGITAPAVDPTPTPAPAADPTPAPDPARAALERQQVPAPSGRSATPASDPKNIWTQAEIRKFYSEVTKGVYPRDRAVQIERDIESAQREGRIR